MGNRRITLLFSHIAPVLLLLAMTEFCWALAQSGQSSGSANPGQGNTATTRTNNPDGSTTVTTTTTYKDGSATTETTYDKDGHDAGTVRTDVQTKDGETTTTITKYDGNGHEIGKTVTRVDKDGNTTVTNYDGNGTSTGTTTLPPFKWKPDWKIGLDYKVPPELRYLPKPKSETQNSAPGPPGTTRVTNPDGTTTITTVTIFNDGWTITITKYDKDGHDAGTTRTDVQTKNGQTTTTTTKWDGNGHETGKTIERGEADGSKTTITYDGSGHETSRTTTPPIQSTKSNTIISTQVGKGLIVVKNEPGFNLSLNLSALHSTEWANAQLLLVRAASGASTGVSDLKVELPTHFVFGFEPCVSNLASRVSTASRPDCSCLLYGLPSQASVTDVQGASAPISNTDVEPCSSQEVGIVDDIVRRSLKSLQAEAPAVTQQTLANMGVTLPFKLDPKDLTGSFPALVSMVDVNGNCYSGQTQTGSLKLHLCSVMEQQGFIHELNELDQLFGSAAQHTCTRTKRATLTCRKRLSKCSSNP